ncbi:MAG: hypothetical protein AAF487_12265 [Bacteroidota bacterium]
MKSITLILVLFLQSFAIAAIEKSDLIKAFDLIYAQRTDEFKLEKSTEFKGLLKDYLNENDPFTADLDGLKLFSKGEKKGKFRIFNWNVPLNEKHHFECFFAVANKKTGFTFLDCTPSKKPNSKIKNRTMSHKDWPSALYYEIVPLQKNSNYFVLLGWDGYDELINRKVIEIIYVSERTIKFGANKFKEYPKPIKRYILEYGDDAIVSINYDVKFKRFVFDHLSPTRPDLEGQYQFYVPDMTFDAFVLKKGDLYFRENIKFLREKQESDKEFYDPRN